MNIVERRALTAVARGEAAADLYVRGGSVLNVYTGEIHPANVAIKGERIAYVGLDERMVRGRTRVVDVRGRVLVPGYIEPHAHPANLVTPSALARHVLPLGTTAMVGDTLQFWDLGGPRAFRAVVDGLATSPLKFYWMLRVHGQSRSADEPRRYRRQDLVRAIRHPSVLAVGEVTRWPDVRAGDPGLLARLELARVWGKRVEGHTAGASAEKIPAIAAGGFTSDHEPITAAEVLSRARQGIAVMLRESSLRPDLRGLLDVLKDAPALVSRLMLTADGAMPQFVHAHGFIDHCIRLAMDGGVAPIDAYRMATLNPATYFGLDGDLGGIAPGRHADVCVLADLSEPRPRMVIARGRVAATHGRLSVRVPEPAWSRVYTSARARLHVRWRARAEDFALPSRERYPVMRLVSTVITRLEERALGADDLYAAVVDREGRWVAPGVLAGFGAAVDGLAATMSTDFNILAIGRSREAMAAAVNRVLAMHGGVALVDGGRVACEVATPLGGIMAPVSLETAARGEQRLHTALAARGYAYHDPLFTLYFLTADFLPTVRLTPRGVWDVKRSRVLLPSRRRS
jgi:adenine deaminase